MAFAWVVWTHLGDPGRDIYVMCQKMAWHLGGRRAVVPMVWVECDNAAATGALGGINLSWHDLSRYGDFLPDIPPGGTIPEWSGPVPRLFVERLDGVYRSIGGFFVVSEAPDFKGYTRISTRNNISAYFKIGTLWNEKNHRAAARYKAKHPTRCDDWLPCAGFDKFRKPPPGNG